ncbi:MAG: hypothetical protein Q4A32_09360 [Lachnospiraceae bacterium]|nr:hypothetical protein [Lachnospiraceae bacterium]
MENKIASGLKTLLLAGIGAAAVTVDKSQEILKDLVDRGELTVEQGKTLNQELKRKITNAQETAEVTYSMAPDKKAEDIIAGLSLEQIAEMKEILLKEEMKGKK